MSRMRMHVHADPMKDRANDSWHSGSVHADESEHNSWSNPYSLYPADFGKGTGTYAPMPSVAPIQRKATVSVPSDPLEREADEGADKLLRMEEPDAMNGASGTIQRKCASCEDEDENKIHAKRDSGASASMDTSMAVNVAQRAGEPLPRETRSFFEPRLGIDLSRVRIGRDNEAAAAAASVQAKAYTWRDKIVFGAGQFAPNTQTGKRLIGHELMHVGQQQGRIGNQLHRDALPAATTLDALPPKSRWIVKTTKGNLLLRVIADAPTHKPDGTPNSVGNLASGTVVEIVAKKNDLGWYQVIGEVDIGNGVRKQRTGFVNKRYLFPVKSATTAEVPEGSGETGAPEFGTADVDGQGLDPSNSLAWLNIADHLATNPDLLSNTLNDVEATRTNLEIALHKNQPPANDVERDIFEKNVRTLVKLNALGSMAAHRSSITFHRKETREQLRQSSGNSAGPGDAKGEMLGAIRKAASLIEETNAKKKQLEDSRHNLRLVESAALHHAGAPPLADWFVTMMENTKEYQVPEVTNIRNSANQAMKSGRSQSELSLIIWGNSKALRELQEEQIDGTQLAISTIYNGMPFFSKVEPKDALGAQSDDKLIELVNHGYDELVNSIDMAIAKIGAEKIDPLDLPVPLHAVQAALPDTLKPAMKEFVDRHHEKELWVTLGWTVAQVALVFLPVIGQFGALARGASLAARLARGTAVVSEGFGAAMPWLSIGADVAMTGVQIDDMLDRNAIADASTSPDKTMLGIGKASKLEWAIQAATAILTAVGIHTSIKGAKDAARLKQLRAEAAALEEATVAHPSGSAIESPLAAREGSADAPTGTRRGVGKTEHIESDKLSPVEIDDELEHIADHPEIVQESGSHQQAKLGEHEWIEEADGLWCRHSKSTVCKFFKTHTQRLRDEGAITKDIWVSSDRVKAKLPTKPVTGEKHVRIHFESEEGGHYLGYAELKLDANGKPTGEFTLNFSNIDVSTKVHVRGPDGKGLTDVALDKINDYITANGRTMREFNAVLIQDNLAHFQNAYVDKLRELPRTQRLTANPKEIATKVAKDMFGEHLARYQLDKLAVNVNVGSFDLGYGETLKVPTYVEIKLTR